MLNIYVAMIPDIFNFPISFMFSLQSTIWQYYSRGKLLRHSQEHGKLTLPPIHCSHFIDILSKID